ncbi:MAG: branched-chain amino acid aminotransferase [Proteobacteria bacterium]|nr:branched-chain amino acid aminotransferase [Pseudomonadota bacterium]
MSALHYIAGEWRQGNPPIMGPMTHAAWMSSVAFDGARAFGGTAPDLDRHCARTVRSALAMGLAPTVDAREIEELAWQGIGRFPEGTELYIRPLFYAEDGFVVPEPDSTRFVLSLFELPLPEPTGFSACLSSTRRPSPETAPTEAKASCLYPQNARALREAKVKGYKNAVVLDMNGNVAEFATANLFIATDGIVHTPVPNRTFLDGITRQRVIGLLRDAGTEVVERTLGYAEVCAADEVFSTGNYAKVSPAIRIEDRDLQPGPLYKQARELYFDFARTCVRDKRV